MANVWAVSCGGATQWKNVWPHWVKNEYVAIGNYVNFPLEVNNIRLTDEEILTRLINNLPDKRLRDVELIRIIKQNFKKKKKDIADTDFINGFVNGTKLDLQGKDSKEQIEEINKIIKTVNIIYSRVKSTQEFAYKILVNEFLIIKSGNHKVLGAAKITGEIAFSNELLPNNYNLFRKVEWIKILEEPVHVEIPQFAQKAVQDLQVQCGSDDIGTIISGAEQDRMKTILTTLGLLKEEVEMPSTNEEKNMQPTCPLNQILFGPPGTGKTYDTVARAMQIFNIKNKDYSVLKKQFDDLKFENRIEFVTFHQSFSYEDFVEGISAETNEGALSYSIKDGIFKKIATEALYSKFEAEFSKEQIDSQWKEVKTITSDIEFDASNYTHKKLILSTCKLTDFKNAKGKGKPYVLIIDEINRGNTSRIFGELITLIEDTKRAGTDEAMTALLPYSQGTFTVPDNLYIIGTMNTADRSLALIDTALRRRFDFIEMMPKPELIKDINIEGTEIDLQLMLQTINDRIEALYDREHTIGHAFFMKLKDEPTVEKLASIFRNNILPLLEEYFFEDWDKITDVLGKSNIYIKKSFDNLGFDYAGKNYSRNDSAGTSALENKDTYINIYKTKDIDKAQSE